MRATGRTRALYFATGLGATLISPWLTLVWFAAVQFIERRKAARR